MIVKTIKRKTEIWIVLSDEKFSVDFLSIQTHNIETLCQRLRPLLTVQNQITFFNSLSFRHKRDLSFQTKNT